MSNYNRASYLLLFFVTVYHITNNAHLMQLSNFSEGTTGLAFDSELSKNNTKHIAELLPFVIAKVFT